MEKSTSKLEEIGERIRSGFSEKHAARERALQASRETIRHCGNAIRAAHRSDYPTARELIESAHTLLTGLSKDLSEHGDLLHSGFVHDAQKEYAEATTTLALILGEALPEPKELGITYAAYLNGLGEAAGEMRRHLLDTLRHGDVSRCEELLECLDDIYSLLVSIDFPDALTAGLRRTTDVVRGILERTRGDLTMAFVQKDLEKKLERFGSAS